MVHSKNFCCLWCRSGPLSALLKVEQTGFVPGETIKITADVDNKSNVKVHSMAVS